ncbi:YciI family protein [Cohnella cholangitidis]|uniref:YciI family protein n=1 Tax=Cohnella cholangitidis TaxID=2598458 RepID=A0A7G5BX13_9BACL|nr:YciI family protein [Cohnella cholangitidis]QMV41497.1 YciI family protein [Cohnella cholangitidis]
MRYMLIVKATGYSESGIHQSREHNDAKAAYKKSLAKAGALLAAEELQPSSTGIRITYPTHGGEPDIQAGPFPADHELMAEYILIDAKTEDEAVGWALRMPVPAGRGECEIELRRLEENSDSLREPRTRALEADLRDQLYMLKNKTQRT